MAAQLLLESTRDFFRVQENFDVLYGLRNRGRGKDQLPSLRVIDHLVTRFARERGICYEVPGGEIPMHLYLAHRAELDRYGKTNIDPFARDDRTERGEGSFSSPDGDGREVRATAKQLNFIRWAIRNRVIDYATRYLDDIRASLPMAGRKRGARPAKLAREVKPRVLKPQPRVANNARLHVGDFRVAFDLRAGPVPK